MTTKKQRGITKRHETRREVYEGYEIQAWAQETSADGLFLPRWEVRRADGPDDMWIPGVAHAVEIGMANPESAAETALQRAREFIDHGR